MSFRIPLLARTLYNEVLAPTDKENIKLIVEGLIYAMARKQLGQLPCEDMIARRLTGIASLTSGQGTVVFNVNINTARAEASPTININIKQADVEYLERLISDLVTLLESKLDGRTLKVLRSRVARAGRILDELRKGVVN